MQYIYKKRFLKQFDRYNKSTQTLIMAAEKEIRLYYAIHRAPHGLRVKKLYDNGNEGTYEARASEKIRIIWVERENVCAFTMVGSHDEVRRYIRSFS